MVDARTERPVPRDLRELEVAYACVQPPRTPASQPVHLPANAGGGAAETALARRPLGIRGTAPGLGQSMVVLGLALAWASMGRRVLVLDLDPTEDLARLLHVGWALRPGNAHTLANVVRTRSNLTPAPTLLAGITIASLGTMPGGHPAEVARGFAEAPAALTRILRAAFDEHDRVLVDLPRAAALVSLEAVVGRWFELDAGAADGRQGPGRPYAGAGQTRTLAQAERTYTIPTLPPSLDHWDMIDGSVGEAADQAFRELALALDRAAG